MGLRSLEGRGQSRLSPGARLLWEAADLPLWRRRGQSGDSNRPTLLLGPRGCRGPWLVLWMMTLKYTNDRRFWGNGQLCGRSGRQALGAAWAQRWAWGDRDGSSPGPGSAGERILPLCGPSRLLLLKGPWTPPLRMEPVSPPGWGPGAQQEGPPSFLSGLVYYKTDLLTMIHIT